MILWKLKLSGRFFNGLPLIQSACLYYAVYFITKVDWQLSILFKFKYFINKINIHSGSFIRILLCTSFLPPAASLNRKHQLGNIVPDIIQVGHWKVGSRAKARRCRKKHIFEFNSKIYFWVIRKHSLLTKKQIGGWCLNHQVNVCAIFFFSLSWTSLEDWK